MTPTDFLKLSHALDSTSVENRPQKLYPPPLVPPLLSPEWEGVRISRVQQLVKRQLSERDEICSRERKQQDHHSKEQSESNT